MDSQFNVVFTGELKSGIERDAFIKAFSQRFQCSEDKATQLLDSGSPTKMKSAVAKEVAEKYRDVLDELGMVITLEPLPSQSEASAPEPAPAAASANPYQAPKADLHESKIDGEMSGPVSVPFSHGSQWISSAYNNHFKGNALAWIGAFVIIVLVNMGLQLIPLIGFIASSLIAPVLTAGLMLGAKAQDEGEDFTIGHAFSGFKQSTGQLVLVGLLYMLGTFAIFMIAGIVMGGSMAMMGGLEAGDPAAAEAMMQDPMAVALPILIMMMLLIPLLMAYWFAPALVALDGISALSAMKLSFLGSIKNVLPFLLYGIVMFVLALLAAIPFFLGYLILLPVMMASMYTAYRDIYYPEA